MVGEICGVHVRPLYRHRSGTTIPAGKKTILMFHSQHCGYCHETLPQLHRATMRLCAYQIFTVDIDAHEELADQFKIEAMPTLVLLSPSGGELKRIEGFQDTESILKFAL